MKLLFFSGNVDGSDEGNFSDKYCIVGIQFEEFVIGLTIDLNWRNEE